MSSKRISPRSPLCILLLVNALLSGCDSNEAPTVAQEDLKREAIERRPVDPNTTGAIQVSVILEGQPPERRQLDLGSEPACDHGEPLLSEFVVAGEEGQLANVLVRLTRGFDSWQTPAPENAPARLTQLGCTYRPHVLAYQRGRELLVSNEDALLHNVHLSPKSNSSSNVVQAAGAAELSIEIHRAELSIPVQCDIHPWMGAWLHVIDHPWFDVTDLDGQALIANVPPGEYQLEILHEKFGRQSVSCIVKSSETTQLQLTFTP